MFLLNIENGKECWTANVKKDIASAILLENNMVVFSTAGGGWAEMFYGETPENYIGIYDLKTKVEHCIGIAPEMRIELKRTSDKIIAYYGSKNEGKFLGFLISQ